MKKHTVAQIGLGSRGSIHLNGFIECADRFEIVGICDIIPERIESAAKRYEIGQDNIYSDAETMVKNLKSDIISFTTLPNARKEFVEMAVKYRAKGLLLEKPMATSIEEANYIKELCINNGIKAVVCHQHKYLSSFVHLKKILDSGELGDVYKIDAACQAHMSELGTHYMDYIIWANQGIGAVSVVGHIHGKDMLNDSHPSPDYMMGEAVMANGVRVNIECGYFTKSQDVYNADYDNKIFPIEFWTDDRLTVYGDKGYAWAECNGRWGAFTSKTGGTNIGGKFPGFLDEMNEAQTRYTEDFAKWMDDDEKIHPCNISQAYHGYEILEAICLSALDKTRIDLPLSAPFGKSVIERIENELPITERKKF